MSYIYFLTMFKTYIILQDMPRPKTTPLDLTRTKAWAHYCAKMICKNENVTTYKLGKKCTSFLESKRAFFPKNNQYEYPHRIDPSQWSRWLNGKRGVERKIVDALDIFCPGTARVFDIGPYVGPWLEQCGALLDEWHEELFKQHLKRCANVPLWASLSGNSERILRDWKGIDKRMWIAWTPDKLSLTDIWNEVQRSEHYFEGELSDSSDEFLLSIGIDPQEERLINGKKITRPKKKYKYSTSEWRWWTPNEFYFSSITPLINFLWKYIENYSNTHPILVFAAMLTVKSDEFDSLGYIFKKRLNDLLSPYSMTMNELQELVRSQSNQA